MITLWVELPTIARCGSLDNFSRFERCLTNAWKAIDIVDLAPELLTCEEQREIHYEAGAGDYVQIEVEDDDRIKLFSGTCFRFFGKSFEVLQINFEAQWLFVSVGM